MLAEHEVINREVSSLRELLEEEKHELERIHGGRRQAEPRRQQHPEDEDGVLQSNDDDVQSIATATGHERVEEEDEESWPLRRKSGGTGGMDLPDLEHQSPPAWAWMTSATKLTVDRGLRLHPRRLLLKVPLLHRKTSTCALLLVHSARVCPRTVPVSTSTTCGGSEHDLIPRIEGQHARIVSAHIPSPGSVTCCQGYARARIAYYPRQ